jgi:CheY-like chemotaxis protein
MPDQSLLSKGVSPNPAERTPTILVVDDEVLIRAMLSDYLQECGYKLLDRTQTKLS